MLNTWRIFRPRFSHFTQKIVEQRHLSANLLINNGPVRFKVVFPLWYDLIYCGPRGLQRPFANRRCYFIWEGLLSYDLYFRAVLLDEILRDPDAPSDELVLDLEVKSLRDTRDLLEKVGLKDALTFIEENPHPRYVYLLVWQLPCTAKVLWNSQAKLKIFVIGFLYYRGTRQLSNQQIYISGHWKPSLPRCRKDFCDNGAKRNVRIASKGSMYRYCQTVSQSSYGY